MTTRVATNRFGRHTLDGLLKGFSHISTAAGAFLEWPEERELPRVKVLLINKGGRI